MEYEIYFRRPNDCVVYARNPDVREVSLLHRRRGGEWHCALCDSTRCPHVEVAEQAVRERAVSRQAVG
jgi:hypothetical protein